MIQITIEHRGRELLHAIELLVRCLQIPHVSRRTRADWDRQVCKAKADLEVLYGNGLARDFVPAREV
jgi:hypothetical protein